MKKLTYNNKIIILVFVFFIVKIIYCIMFGWNEIPEYSDGISYNNYANEILKSDSWINSKDFYGDFRPPGYPLFLAFVYSIFGTNNFIAVYVIQCLLNVVSIVYIYMLALKLIDKKVAVMSIVFSGMYYYYYYYAGMILRESVVQLCVISIFYHFYTILVEKHENIFKKKDVYMFVVAYVYLVHTDAKYMFYFPFFIIIYLHYKINKKQITNLIKIVCLISLLMVPWIIRNYFVYDKFVLVNTRTLDRYAERLLSKMKKSDEPKKENFDSVENFPTEEERILVKSGIGIEKYSKNEIYLIRNDVYPPKTYIEKSIYRFKEMWFPVRFSCDYDFWPPRCRLPYSNKHNAVSIVWYFTIFPFFVAGMIIAIVKKNKKIIYIIFPIFIHALLHIITMFGKERHRIQIDSFIIILAMFGMVNIYNNVKGLKLKKLKIRN